MRIEINHNNLLTINNPNIPQIKEYTYNVWWYVFSDYDKWMIVLHKKDRKIINLKNLSDNMNVVYMKDGEPKNMQIDTDAIGQAFWIFDSFNETTGQTYFFIPNMSGKEVAEKNQILKNLHSEYRLQKTDKWVITKWIPFTGTDKRLSFLFGLTLLYGKFDTKKDELVSIKIQLPLFGQYMKYTETIDQMIRNLQEHGFFMKVDKLTNKNGIIYQISSNDYELLEIFASRYEAVEKFTKITKREFTDEMKEKLIIFLETNPDIPSEGKTETIKKIKEWTIKLLTK